MTLASVLLFVWIAYPVTCDRCPPPALKNRHALERCADPKYYHCLWNKHADDYHEVCLKPQRFTAGSYVVFANNLDARECPTDRYQPFPFKANELNACVYMKSTCTEEGQIIGTSGSTTDDATCKCDYTKGYSYVVLPKDPCSCKPSEDDCSCFVTDCLNVTHQLSSDYKCEQINAKILRQYQCPRISSKSKDDVHHTPRYITTEEKSKDNMKSADTFIVAGMVTGMVVLMIVVFVVAYVESGFQSPLQALIDRSNKHFQKVMRADIVQDINIFRHAKTVTENNDIIILKGRQGTGKTTLAIYLASIYTKQKYKLAILDRYDRDTLVDIQRSSEKFVIILEEWFDASDTNTEATKLQSDMLDSHNFQNDFEVIVTATNLDEHRLQKLRLNGIVTGNNVVNLDKESPEHTEDNQSIMRCLLAKYNRDLSDDAIKEAAETNTYYGFPLQCVLFCRDSRTFELGSKYFRQPQGALMDMVNDLKSSENQQNRIMYCILVYIILNPETGLPINDLDVANITCIFKDVYNTSFWGKSLSEKDVKDACLELYSKDILLTGNTVYFLPPVVYQAAMLSYDYACFGKIIEKCEMMQVLDIIRPLTYEKLEGEVVLIIDLKKVDSRDILAKKIALACLDDEAAIPRIVQYIRKCKFAHVLQNTIDHLKTKLKTLITDKRIENVMIFMEQMTCNNSLELLDYTPTHFVLTWTLMALRKSGQNDLIQILIDRYIKRGNRRISVEILRTVVDQHNNSFLHYCVLWWHNKDNPFIRYLDNEFQTKFDEWATYTNTIFDITNNHQMSAVDFAAYFGNHELLPTFIRFKMKIAVSHFLPAGKVAKVIKDVYKLLQYTEHGKTNNIIQSYSSCPYINMTVCGPIDVNDTFNYDKAAIVLTSIKKKF